MGPRPDGRGKAAGLAPRGTLALRQWGRGQTAAESPYDRLHTLAFVGRQWGRGQTAAESRRHDLSRPAWRASMGPRPDGRGKMLAAPFSEAILFASMGPRPDGRGKMTKARADVIARQRQWGRGQTAAESLGPGRSHTRPPRVNGAAARRPRKVAPVYDLGRTGTASMGPRPDGRGKDFSTRMCGGRRWASMGPRPDGRGKVPNSVFPWFFFMASMGPRPDGRGK